MKNNNPLISIIIPSYNVASYLPDACDSLLAQTYANWEGIIIDDGSSKDNTAEVAQAYCAKDKRFRYIYQENKGLSGARKTGIDAAKGAYIQFLDADDALLPSRLEEMLQIANQADEKTIFYSDFTIGLNNTLKGNLANSSRPHSIGRALHFMDMFTGWRTKFLFVPACPFFPTAIFSTIDYDASLRSVEDWDLYLSILSKGYVFMPMPSKNILYRENPGGLSKNKTYIYTQLFYMLDKWKNTTPVSFKQYDKTIARLYSEIIFMHYWNKNTEIVKPTTITNKIQFYAYTIAFLVKRVLGIITNAIMKRIKKRP